MNKLKKLFGIFEGRDLLHHIFDEDIEDVMEPGDKIIIAIVLPIAIYLFYLTCKYYPDVFAY